jgi:putative membrane protein
MRILLAILGNVLALYATTVVPGITFSGGLITILLAGIIFGLFNAIVRPILTLLSLPFLIVTLGLFYFILNGILLVMASWFIPGYRVEGLVAGILGGLVLTVVNWILNAMFKEEKPREA